MEFSICGESETLESVTHGYQSVTAQTILFVKQSKAFVISSTQSTCMHINVHANTCMHVCCVCMHECTCMCVVCGDVAWYMCAYTCLYLGICVFYFSLDIENSTVLYNK